MRLDLNWAREQYLPRRADTHKGTYGHVVVIGGSRDMAGAVAMTAYASLKAGAGLCTVVAPYACREAVYGLCPEAMIRGVGNEQTPHLEPAFIPTIEEAMVQASAVVLGPGMDQTPEVREFVRELLVHVSVPLVLDADGLNVLAAEPELWEKLPSDTILTPHPGEMRRLTGLADVNLRRLETAEGLAQKSGCTVVLKGAGTVVASPNGHSYINTSGNPGMATGGSGDILAGVIGALLARGYEAGTAAALGVFLHGWAGDLASEKHSQEGLLAAQIAKELEAVWLKLREQ